VIRVGGHASNFFALAREHVSNRVAGDRLAERVGDDDRHQLRLDRLRQVVLDARQLPGVDLIAHRYTQADRQPFPAVNLEHRSGGLGALHVLGRLGRVGAEDLIANVEDLNVVDERRDEMHAGIECAADCAGELADPHACLPAGNDDDAERRQQRHPGEHHETAREAPPNRRVFGGAIRALNVGQQDGDGGHEQPDGAGGKGVLHEQHDSSPLCGFPRMDVSVGGQWTVAKRAAISDVSSA
jgi:hypothetical protein